MIMKRISVLSCCKLFLSFVLIGVLCSFNFKENEVISIKFDPKIKDYTPIVLEAIHKAEAEGAYKIVFEKGDYHFFNDKAFEKLCFVSNHDDGLRRIAFPIIGFDNFEIDGGGANFLFHGPMIPFAIEKSKNIKISNLSVNWEYTFSSELKVVATDKDKKSIDFKISDQYPYRIENGNLIFFRKDYEHTLETGFYWDPKTKAVAYNSAKCAPIKTNRGVFEKFEPISEVFLYEPFVFKTMDNKMPLAIKAVQLEPGLVRVTGIDTELPKVGWIYVCKGYNSENRYSPAVRISGSENLKLQDIQIYHAGGMGLIAEKSTNIELDKFNVILPEKSTRMVSTTADATHFVNCKGLVKIQNCRFENQLDDATNIHGVYTEITRIVSNKSVEVKLGHFQQRGFDFAQANDSLAIVDKGLLTKKKIAVVDKVQAVNNKYLIITFKEDLKNYFKIGDLLDNISWYPEAILRNNIAINNKSRGFLISTPKKVLIEGNTFSNMMSAILVDAPKFNWWYESGNPQDLTIRNNKFLDGAYGTAGRQALIEIHTQSPGLVKNIKITDNSFTTFSPFILKAEGVYGIEFTNNKIQESFNYPISLKPKAMIMLPDCENINVSNNQVVGFKGFKLVEKELP